MALKSHIRRPLWKWSRKELAKGRAYLGPVYQTPCELKMKVTEGKDTEKEAEVRIQIIKYYKLKRLTKL